ncbi:S-formylglutathione hydrolase-like isoform X2 [Teleopsis dalmanni]|nr:S-formylglutathione hydrolase isoform X2 [Teleopsis dalmanni]XP_037948903.1 S-formylglutathione hydrolase isoform X2 [Teleopsis dalmanni]XP_037948904.1 S-formylglutathione hydrolase isoform X2 [Teleopsis dalmanni]XP_037948906.1 S-formylglutathione hydrolase isoform X2 [Teleopsis dalmanni]XP_037954011.1 S-formylglutathione hydrolase-like isoform X2 [Teleopsis dalmanni]XP_037954012.1 S-formylglutathione hydrolase-like isoform X2 [Teleopsis dalmanni]XP_037954013.1 S-formylglutathione hydrolas
MSMKLLSTVKSFGGEQRVYSHVSDVLGCEMKFGVYVPQAVIEDNKKCPVLYFLSGLTCTHENFIQKAGMQQYASKYDLIVVNPDTSPRNIEIAGQDDSYDFGSGASFYVDATEKPWSKHYKMFTYVTKELVDLIDENLPTSPNKRGIFGHSMGGHGALICALKNPGLYQSVSAFAPISNPTECPWGKKALGGYLGENANEWKEWDATELIKNYTGVPMQIFVDQGTADNFLKEGQLLPQNLLQAAGICDHISLIYKERDGYDHGYFYINTFIGEHLEYHSKLLEG